MYTYNCFIKRVIDGDTFIGIVDLGFSVKKEERFRVANIDTPESWRPKTESEKKHGEAAKKRAIELLEGKTLVIKTGKTGKYGRYITEVILPDNLDYARVMIQEGFEKRDNYTD